MTWSRRGNYVDCKIYPDTKHGTGKSSQGHPSLFISPAGDNTA